MGNNSGIPTMRNHQMEASGMKTINIILIVVVQFLVLVSILTIEKERKTAEKRAIQAERDNREAWALINQLRADLAGGWPTNF